MMSIIVVSPNKDGRKTNANLKEGKSVGNDTHNVAAEYANPLDSSWSNWHWQRMYQRSSKWYKMNIQGGWRRSVYD